MIGVVRALGKLAVLFAVFMLPVAVVVVLVVVAVSFVLVMLIVVVVAKLSDRDEESLHLTVTF